MPLIYESNCPDCGHCESCIDTALVCRAIDDSWVLLRHPGESYEISALGYTFSQASKDNRLFLCTFSICASCGQSTRQCVPTVRKDLSWEPNELNVRGALLLSTVTYLFVGWINSDWISTLVFFLIPVWIAIRPLFARFPWTQPKPKPPPLLPKPPSPRAYLLPPQPEPPCCKNPKPVDLDSATRAISFPCVQCHLCNVNLECVAIS